MQVYKKGVIQILLFPFYTSKTKLFLKRMDPSKIKYRLAVDYRLLNEILENNPYPTPNVKEILQSISGKTYYTVMDFHTAFMQIKLKPEDRSKLAFVTEYGKCEPTRLNYGTKISSTIFAELIDKILNKFD